MTTCVMVEENTDPVDALESATVNVQVLFEQYEYRFAFI
jgi:hypothetical protein